jgi:hypothetical protein
METGTSLKEEDLMKGDLTLDPSQRDILMPKDHPIRESTLGRGSSLRRENPWVRREPPLAWSSTQLTPELTTETRWATKSSKLNNQNREDHPLNSSRQGKDRLWDRPSSIHLKRDKDQATMRVAPPGKTLMEADQADPSTTITETSSSLSSHLSHQDSVAMREEALLSTPEMKMTADLLITKEGEVNQWETTMRAEWPPGKVFWKRRDPMEWFLSKDLSRDLSRELSKELSRNLTTSSKGPPTSSHQGRVMRW